MCIHTYITLTYHPTAESLSRTRESLSHMSIYPHVTPIYTQESLHGSLSPSLSLSLYYTHTHPRRASRERASRVCLETLSRMSLARGSPRVCMGVIIYTPAESLSQESLSLSCVSESLSMSRMSRVSYISRSRDEESLLMSRMSMSRMSLARGSLWVSQYWSNIYICKRASRSLVYKRASRCLVCLEIKRSSRCLGCRCLVCLECVSCMSLASVVCLDVSSMMSYTTHRDIGHTGSLWVCRMSRCLEHREPVCRKSRCVVWVVCLDVSSMSREPLDVSYVSMSRHTTWRHTPYTRDIAYISYVESIRSRHTRDIARIWPYTRDIARIWPYTRDIARMWPYTRDIAYISYVESMSFGYVSSHILHPYITPIYHTPRRAFRKRASRVYLVCI